jgi:hypothetical protein
MLRTIAGVPIVSGLAFRRFSSPAIIRFLPVFIITKHLGAKSKIRRKLLLNKNQVVAVSQQFQPVGCTIHTLIEISGQYPPYNFSVPKRHFTCR